MKKIKKWLSTLTNEELIAVSLVVTCINILLVVIIHLVH